MVNKKKGADGKPSAPEVRFSLLAEREGECGESQEARSQNGCRTKPACTHRFRAAAMERGGMEFGDFHCRLLDVVAALQYRAPLMTKQ